jgi:hypothetical protein
MKHGTGSRAKPVKETFDRQFRRGEETRAERHCGFYERALVSL